MSLRASAGAPAEAMALTVWSVMRLGSADAVVLAVGAATLAGAGTDLAAGLALCFLCLGAVHAAADSSNAASETTAIRRVRLCIGSVIEMSEPRQQPLCQW